MESKISLDAKLKQSELQSVPELERTYKLVDHSHNLITIDKEVYVINTIGYCGRPDDLDLRYCSYLFCYDISDKSFHVKGILHHGKYNPSYDRNSVFIRVGFFPYYARLGVGNRTFLDRYDTRYSGNWEPLTPSNRFSHDPSHCCAVSDGV